MTNPTETTIRLRPSDHYVRAALAAGEAFIYQRLAVLADKTAELEAERARLEIKRIQLVAELKEAST